MRDEFTEKATGLIEHIIGTLLHVWWRVARIGLLAGVCGALATEVVAAIVTHRFPSGTAHLAAAALGIALAYAAAATALISEILLGLLHTMRVVEGDAEAGALAAAAIARHEARAATNDLGSLFGLRRSAATPVIPATTSLPRPQRPPVPARPPRGPAANMPAASTPAIGRMMPATFEAELPPQLPPLPVRADHLPRIGWANETAPTNPPSTPSWDAPAGASSPSGLASAPLASGPSEPFGFASVAAVGAAGIAIAAERHHARQSAPVEAVAPVPVLDAPTLDAPVHDAPTVVVGSAPELVAEALPAPTTADAPTEWNTTGRESEQGIEATVVPTLTVPSPVVPTLAPLADLYDDAPLVAPPAMPSLPLAEDARGSASVDVTAAPASGATEAARETSQETRQEAGAREPLPVPSVPDPLEGPPTIPRPGGRLTRPLAPITSPLAAPSSDPLAAPTGSGNLWDRLSQALLGVPPASTEAAREPSEAPSGAALEAGADDSRGATDERA